MGAGREGTGRRAFSKALRRGIEQRPVLPEWSYGSKGQQADHKGPGELLSDLDFLPIALGHHGRVGRRAGSTVLEETSDGCLFKSRGTSKAGYPDLLHPPGQSLPTAKARVRDSSLPLWPLGLQSRKELYVRRRCCGSRLPSPGRKQLASLSQATEKPTEQVTATLPLFSERLGMLLTHEPFSQKGTPAHHPQKWPHFLLGLVLPTALPTLPQDPVSLVRC